MNSSIRLLIYQLVFLFMLSGCAAVFSPKFEEPSLQVNSIRLKNSNSLAPEFEISLRVTNPNRDALSIDGMIYTLYMDGNKVVSGAASDLPTIPAYGEAEVKIMATLSLLGGFKLLNDLIDAHRESVKYELVTRVDVGKFYPMFTIKKEGVFSF